MQLSTLTALNKFNHDYNKAWTFGANFRQEDYPEFETFINKYLFPKLNETTLSNTDLGNRFDWLAREVEYIGQYSEEYIIKDVVPVAMNLSKSEELMLKRNYPDMATKIYGAGVVKKVKFTLNNNDVRQNWNTLGDATSYALGVYAKRISDINVTEESEIKGMLVDYALNQTNERRSATSYDDVVTEVYNALLNLQNNSSKYNETNLASGGAVGRYTTHTKLKDVMILTSDRLKTFLLDSKIANQFNASGIDITDKIISFDELGGIFKLTDDVTIAEQSTVNFFKSYGDYQMTIGDVLPADTVVTIPLDDLDEFVGNYEEVKPESELFTLITDIRKVRYTRNTKGMLKEPFYNPEYDEVTWWIHYYSMKAVSPFYNNILISGDADI